MTEILRLEVRKLDEIFSFFLVFILWLVRWLNSAANERCHPIRDVEYPESGLLIFH